MSLRQVHTSKTSLFRMFIYERLFIQCLLKITGVQIQEFHAFYILHVHIPLVAKVLKSRSYLSHVWTFFELKISYQCKSFSRLIILCYFICFVDFFNNNGFIMIVNGNNRVVNNINSHNCYDNIIWKNTRFWFTSNMIRSCIANLFFEVWYYSFNYTSFLLLFV